MRLCLKSRKKKKKPFGPVFWLTLCVFIWRKHLDYSIYVHLEFCSTEITVLQIFLCYKLCTFLSNTTPRNLIVSTRLNSQLLRKKRKSSFLLRLWKNEYFASLILSESLLEINHWLILWSSLFTLRNKALKSLCEWNNLLLSASMIGSNIKERNWRS